MKFSKQKSITDGKSNLWKLLNIVISLCTFIYIVFVAKAFLFSLYYCCVFTLLECIGNIYIKTNT